MAFGDAHSASPAPPDSFPTFKGPRVSVQVSTIVAAAMLGVGLAFGAVANANEAPTGLPTISGNAQVGARLTADTSAISDADGLTGATFAHQWVRVDGSEELDVSGATASTYSPVNGDVGKALKVKVTFTDDGGTEESLTSAASALIEVPPTISIADATTVTEGAAAVFQVSLSKAGNSPAQVSWFTADHTATGGADYTASPANGGTLTIGAGETSATIEVATTDDSITEGDERFSVRLFRTLAEGTKTWTWTEGSLSGATLDTDNAIAAGVIRDDETALTLTGSASVSHAENAASRVAAYSAGTAENLTWTLSGADAAKFFIDEPGGVLRFKTPPDFESAEDADADNVYAVTVEAAGSAADSRTSQAVSITVTDTDEPGTLAIASGNQPRLGEALTANPADVDGIVDGTTTYVWQRSAGRKAWIDIDGAESASYKPSAADTGNFLRVNATYQDSFGAGKTASATTSNVVAAHLLSALSVSTTDSESGSAARKMIPAFDPRILHYAVGCGDADTMTINASAADPTARMTFRSRQVAANNASAKLAVSGAEDLRISLSGANGETTTYVVHCLPDDFLPVSTVKRVSAGVMEDLIMFDRRWQDGNHSRAMLTIIDNNAVPRLRKQMIEKSAIFFRPHRTTDGDWQYTYDTALPGVQGIRIVALDHRFELVERVTTASPLTHTDAHDHRLLANGNYLLLAYEPATRDLSHLAGFVDSSLNPVTFGTTESTWDSAVQLRKPDGTAAFTWNSWDAMALEDCYQHRFPPTHPGWAHVNSAQIYDGDIIATFRGCSKILRIDPGTSNATAHKVVWRMGRSNLTRSQWQARSLGPPPLRFIGDPEGEFCGMHGGKVLPNGNLMVFDNGSPCLVNPWTYETARDGRLFSRGVEYALDLTNNEAIFLRNHSLHGERAYGARSSGHIEDLATGDWLISWGRAPATSQVRTHDNKKPDEAATQVDPDTGKEKLSIIVPDFDPSEQMRIRAIPLSPVALADDRPTLTAQFIATTSASPAGTTGATKVILAFNHPVLDFTTSTPSLEVQGATLDAVVPYLDPGAPANAYAVSLTHTATETVTLTAVANKTCASGGICTAAGEVLTKAPDEALNLAGPRLATASVNGTTLKLEYDQVLDTASVPSPSDFSVVANGTARSVDAVAITDAVVTLTLASAADHGQWVTLSYSPGTQPIRGPTGASAPPLSGWAIPETHVSVADAQAQEGDDLTFAVTLSRAVAGDLTANWTLANGTAVAGGDFPASQSGTLTIPAQQTAGTIRVRTTEDSSFEPDETLLLTLAVPHWAALKDAPATGRIINDDSRGGGGSGTGGGGGGGGSRTVVRILHADPVPEGSPARFHIELESPTRQRLDFLASTAERTASEGTDYLGRSSFPVSVAEGESEAWIEVPTARDAEVEGEEIFTLTLSMAPGSVDANIVRREARGTILDGPPPTASVPLFPAGGSEVRHGFLRVLDRGWLGGPVSVAAADDGGVEGTASVLQLASRGAAHFNSSDLENGNATKSLMPGTGAPTRGDWRLRLDGADIEALAYVRTGDGFVTPLGRTVPAQADGSRFVAFFNPGSNYRQVSLLRLINPGKEPAQVTVEGIDDSGASPGTPVVLTLPGVGARTLSAQELERGATGLEGTLGDGEGKWRLRLRSDQPVAAMSLLESPAGHLANLSVASGPRTHTEDGSVRTLAPLFPSASDPDGRQGFLRVINRGSETVEAHIQVLDDAGESHPPLTLTVDAREAVHINSHDLEQGAPRKGLPIGTGTGEGNWRLRVVAPSEVVVLAYLRHLHDGFVTSMNSLAPKVDRAHWVPFFNPASNTRQVSLLRLDNPGEAPALLTILGTDDVGASPPTPVSFTLPAHSVRTLTATDLESGGEGLEGALGDGEGKWRLRVASDQPVRVMSLLQSPTGHLANLSAASNRDGH